MTSNGKVALVTGANRGIGLETARQLGRLGFQVLVGSRDLAKGVVAADELRAEGLAADAIEIDHARSETWIASAQWIDSAYRKLDVLVNNAGILRDKGVPASTVPIDDLRETYEANFFGLVGLTQVLLPLIERSEEGRIVNVGSILGSMTMNADPNDVFGDWRSLGYNSSKAAVNLFTVMLATELKRRGPVKVNTAHPGWVRTGLGGEDAPIEVAEGAETLVWLATLDEDGPTGGFFHKQRPLAW